MPKLSLNYFHLPKRQSDKIRNALSEISIDELQTYPPLDGNVSLRKLIAREYKVHYNEVIIFDSSTQALYLSIQAIAADNLLVHRPNYFILDTLHSNTYYWHNLIELHNLLKRLKGTSIIYANTFSNTITGKTFTNNDLIQLYAVSKNSILLLDNPYSLTASKYKHFGNITLGSFSKLSGPGIRIGYAIFKNPKEQKAVRLKKMQEGLGANMLSQLLLESLYNKGIAHINVGSYKILVNSLVKEFPAYKWTEHASTKAVTLVLTKGQYGKIKEKAKINEIQIQTVQQCKYLPINTTLPKQQILKALRLILTN